MISPVNNISKASFRGTDRAKATAGVEQNKPMLTLKQNNAALNNSRPSNFLLCYGHCHSAEIN